MQEIIKEYGPALITVVAVIAIIAILAFLLQNNGFVSGQFQNLMTGFFNKATSTVGF